MKLSNSELKELTLALIKKKEFASYDKAKSKKILKENKIRTTDLFLSLENFRYLQSLFNDVKSTKQVLSEIQTSYGEWIQKQIDTQERMIY